VVGHGGTVCAIRKKKRVKMKEDKVPLLNIREMENLLNAPANQMLIINHMNNTINQPTYAGLPVAVRYDVANIARAYIEKMPQMRGRRLVATAVRGVPAFSWNGADKFVRYAMSDDMSQYMVGNIITFNLETKQFESNPAGWMGLKNDAIKSQDGKFIGLDRFLLRLWVFANIRNTLLSPFGKGVEK